MKFLLQLHEQTVVDLYSKFLSLLEKDKNAALLDLGCGRGEFTVMAAGKIGTNSLWGIDINKGYLFEASKRDIKTRFSNLNKAFPFEDETFNVIISQQVIEHLYFLDSFIKEVFRVLKPNGYAVISTENLASWHNVFALLLGYQPFSCSVSEDFNIGNPFSPHYMESVRDPLIHVRILTPRALEELLKIQGFQVEKIVGAGYYPFSGKFSSLIASLNPSHAHFIIVKVRKSDCNCP